jgi:hypothetical protein
VRSLDEVDFPPTKKFVAEEHRYEYETGELAFQVRRIEYQAAHGGYLMKDGKRKKSFSQCRPDPNKPGASAAKLLSKD